MKASLIVILAIAFLASTERSFAHAYQPADVKTPVQMDPAGSEKKITESAPADSGLSRDNETMVVSFQFSPLEIDSSLANYLNLTPRQLRAVQRLISQQHREIEPLKIQLQSSHQKLLAASDQGDAKETETLAATEARILTRLLIKSAHIQAKLHGLLTHEQQKKLEELNHSRQP